MRDYKVSSAARHPRTHRTLALFVGIACLGAGALYAAVSLMAEPASSEPSHTASLGLTLPGQTETEATAGAPAPAETTDHPPTAEPAAIPEPARPTAATLVATADASTPLSGLKWQEHKIRSGDSLARIFKQFGLSPSLLHKLVHTSPETKKLADIRPGETLRVALNGEGEFSELLLVRSPVEQLRISRENGKDAFMAEEIHRDVERRVAFSSATIDSSLFLAGQKAKLSDAQIMELAGIFGWDIDFALEIREGDRFHVVYEEEYLDGEKYGDGPILAAEFINQGEIYRAVRYTDPKGNTDYYAPDGRSKRRAFIRTPVKFSRISSGFTRKRFHPVLKTWRSHKGVDYAAPRGTPVKVTGNGKVIFRGRKGGYGNVVIVQHGGKYTTVYAHLSKFSKYSKSGARLKQGQVIGYVGSTGLASGPHLHYEFRVNGVHRNPLKVKLPKAEPIAKKYLDDFRAKTQTLVAQLDTIARRTQLASAE